MADEVGIILASANASIYPQKSPSELFTSENIVSVQGTGAIAQRFAASFISSAFVIVSSRRYPVKDD